MKKILINFAHPSKARSIMNTALLAAVKDLDNVYVNDLYSNYPDFIVDIKREQNLCKNSDVIIFQHPFYWYSTPAILKEWQDLVLQHGWAYGSNTNALQGKYFMQAITAGGSEKTYKYQGVNHFSINELLSPYHAMANLCKMEWLPPFVVFGIHQGIKKEQISIYSNTYRRIITALRDDEIDFNQVKEVPFINSNVDLIIKEELNNG